MDTDALSPALLALARLCALEDRPEAQETAAVLRRAGTIPALPACQFDAAIRAVLATSPVPVARSLLAAQALIPWGVNPVAANMTEGAAAIIAVSTLLGPEGPIQSDRFRAGLLYLASDCYYPLHDHDADETYVILAGAALWTAGPDTSWRRAGEVIHHPSLMPHAFRTGAEGLVAFWRWSGDINTQSYRFLPDPAA